MNKKSIVFDNSQLLQVKNELIEEANKLIAIDYDSIRNERFIKSIFCPYCMKMALIYLTLTCR